MRCILSLFILFYIITSCNDTQYNEREGFKIKKTPLSLVADSLNIAGISFDGIFKKNQLAASNSIPQAQSKAEWILAAKNKRGVWCYIDTLNELGVLYNGYCIDKISLKNNFLLPDSIYRGFENKIQTKPKQLENYDTFMMTERNENGNFYNLGYHSFWVGTESISGAYNAVSVDQVNGDVQVRPVNPGNGYFIRFLK